MNRSPYGRTSSLGTASPRSYLGNSPRDSVTSTAGKLPRKDWDALDKSTSVQQSVSPVGASLPLDAALPDVSRIPGPAPPGPYAQYQRAEVSSQRRRLEPAGLGEVYSPRYVQRGGSGGITGSMVPEQWGHVKLASADGYFSYAGGVTSLRRPFTSTSVGIIPGAAANTAHLGDGKMLGPPEGVEIGDLPHSAVAIPDVRRNLAEKSLLDRAAARQSERDEKHRENEYQTEDVWLKVVVVSAHGLRVADEDTGSSDPYCICEVAGKADMKFRTPVVNQTLEPVWKHVHDFPVVSQSDSLRFSVYDQDDDWSELLGRAKLEAADIFPKGFNGEVKLTEAGTEEARLVVQVHVLRNEDAKKAALQSQRDREQAAMRIQASMRGKQARVEVDAAKEELERYKNHARELKAKEDQEEKRRREREEQKRKDREVAEQRLRKIKLMKKENAAITIQSWWRGWKFRRIVEHHVRLKKFEREKARRQKENAQRKAELERRAQEENLEKQRRKQRLEDKIRRVEAQWPTRAALKIQSWWRRVLLRRTVAYRMRKKEEEKKRQIEREIREERDRFEREQERARQTQAQRRQKDHDAAEAKLRELKEKQRVAAVVKLQSWRRGQLTRRDHNARIQAKRKAEEERRQVREKERLAEQERLAEVRRREEEERRRENMKREQQQKDAAMLKLLQLEMKQQQKAVLMVQAARRGQLARRRRDELAKERQAEARRKQKEFAARKAEDFERRKREEAAAKIQRLVLGFSARCRVRALRRKKAVDQAAEVARKEKMAAARKAREFKAKRMSDAAKKVQAVWRGRMQKQRYQEEVRRRKEELALERKMKDREVAKRKYYELDKKRREEAARKIQSAFRGKAARRNFSEKQKEKAQLDEMRKKELRLAKEAKDAEEKANEKAKNDAVVKEKLAAMERQRREQAAIAVQRHVRGGLARKHYQKTKKEIRDRDQAQRLKLQKEKEAKQHREKEEARRREREAAEQKLQELELAKMNVAATKLQRMARGYFARRDYQATLEEERRQREREKKRRAAEQEHLRLEKQALERQKAREAAERKLAELQERSRADAASRIQAGWRGRSARQEVAEKRRQIAEVERARELERQAMLEYERRRSLERRQEEQAQKRKELARERQLAREAAEKKLEEMQTKRQSAAASKIQANVRRFLARRAYLRKKQRKDEEDILRRTKQAASKKEKEREAVQKKLQELEEKRRNQAATKIQAARRGQVARNGMTELKSQKVAHERERRLNRQRERTRQIEEAEQKERRALEEKLQALDAAKRKRYEVEHAHEFDAATKIQAVWRGRRARQDLKHSRKKAWKDAKADLYRDPDHESFEMKLAKKRMEMEDRLRTKAEERRYEEFVKRQEMLASRLQQVREAADAKRRELEIIEREKAAVKIQAFRRGRVVRREYEAELSRRKEETRLLYEDSRRYAEDKRAWDLEYMRQDEAAVTIQSFYRGHRDRKRVSELRQKLWEEAQEELYRAGREYEENLRASFPEEEQVLHDAASKIQNWWRKLKIDQAINKLASGRDLTSNPEDLLQEDLILVTLDKSGGDSWGLEVDTSSDSENLRILAIDGGLAEEWNHQNPEKIIVVGDEIIQVNDVRGDRSAMLAEIQQSSVLEIVLRCKPEASGTDENGAALIIQSAWRGWRARRELEMRQRKSQDSGAKASNDGIESAQLLAASGKIQSIWRGVMGRRIAEAKRRRKDLGYRLRRPVGRRTLQGDGPDLLRPSLLGRRVTRGDGPDVSTFSSSRIESTLPAVDEGSPSEASNRQSDHERSARGERPVEKKTKQSDSPATGDLGELPTLNPPLGWRPVPPTPDKRNLDGMKYESAWRRSIERRAMEESGFPVHDRADDETEQQAAFTTHQQLSTMISQKKREVQEQQQMVRKCKAEEERLLFLVSLSQDGQRCSRCDVRVANLATILGALRRLMELLSLSTKRQTGAVMNGLAKVLDNVAHTDPHLAQMAAYVEDSLLSSRGDGRRTYM